MSLADLFAEYRLAIIAVALILVVIIVWLVWKYWYSASSSTDAATTAATAEAMANFRLAQYRQVQEKYTDKDPPVYSRYYQVREDYASKPQRAGMMNPRALDAQPVSRELSNYLASQTLFENDAETVLTDTGSDMITVKTEGTQPTTNALTENIVGEKSDNVLMSALQGN